MAFDQPAPNPGGGQADANPYEDYGGINPADLISGLRYDEDEVDHPQANGAVALPRYNQMLHALLQTTSTVGEFGYGPADEAGRHVTALRLRAMLAAVGLLHGRLVFRTARRIADEDEEGGPPGEDQDPRNPRTAIYLRFRWHWDSWMGRPAAMAMPQAAPFLFGLEEVRFPHLFDAVVRPYAGGIMGDMDGYIRERIMDFWGEFEGRFQTDQEWLKWAVKRTESRDVECLINMCLFSNFGIKAIHVGGGQVICVDRPRKRFPVVLMDDFLNVGAVRHSLNDAWDETGLYIG